MTAAEFIRENSWVVVAGIMLLLILFKLSKELARRHSRSRRIVSHKDPDNMPELDPILRRARWQIILATIAIIAFTAVAIMNTL